VIIGGTGDRILALAARRADTVAVGGLMQAPHRPPGTFQLLNASQTDERIAFIRSQAGDRAAVPELNVLVQMVVVTPDRRATAAKLAAEFGTLGQDDVLQSPYLLLGTAAEIAAQLREHRERFGFSSVTVHEPYMTAFAPVIEQLG
jgi:alkanesulfonate monooxygenase SsuD/methylene tetrahydromethanopterin reductase-like flavin-dependent oxidoreductase (luciferase family)